MSKYAIGDNVVLRENQLTWYGFNKGIKKDIPLNAGDIFIIEDIEEDYTSPLNLAELDFYRTLHLRTNTTFYFYDSALERYFNRMNCIKTNRKLLR